MKIWIFEMGSEYDECKAFWEWAQFFPYIRDYLIKHVNEGKRSNITGKRLKDIGLRPGVPDYQYVRPNQKYCGFWIEMKRPCERNKAKREEQIEWIAKLRESGHYANFAYGWFDAREQLLAYIENNLILPSDV